ncbi:glycosyl hydrolase family 18 protein [Acetivibrio straminisolvens]|uniref:Spore peptidoglycan hydrolase n=1 Tax=Acetivibrio straminisolvens JCM 21531 TaxID=1294263 RepID=W4V4E4_9FIRM|nr:glycosyl hydrolase family 18 protein [Acetivibrio straminisolvens]GAE88315.1 spore peptidoglycan hydrolase [Acetivibrio straminisolvens JCM 21531]
MKNEKGELINRAYSKYVDWAHSKGYQVWALLSNDFTDSEMTSKFLNNTDARDNLIKEILAYAALYKLDGINIDFENMYNSDRDVFTQFVREISPLLREQGLVVSVDVNDIKCYDKKALSEPVDYIMYMSYDQHWSTSLWQDR